MHLLEHERARSVAARTFPFGMCQETPARRGHSPRTWWRGELSPPTLQLGASPRGMA